MRRTTRRGPAGPSGLAASEAGFALIEVMVSAVLLLVLAIGTLAMLEQTVKSSSMNRSRNIAATLAQADQEHMRQLPLGSIAGGYHPAPATKTLGGVPYTVTSSGDWTRDVSGAVTCSADSTGRAEYLTITSKVTWPNMGQTKPIVIQSVVAPGVAALGGGKGALAIKLKRADGSGTQGITVASGAVSGVTDADGCVVLANLDEGTRNVTWNQAGYVDPDGDQSITKPETITAATTAQDNGAYDRAAVLRAGFVDDQVPAQAVSWQSVSMIHVGMVKNNGVKVFKDPTGTAKPTITTATGLFPFTSPYGYYAGGCDGNDPLSYGPETAAKAQSWTFLPGTSVDKAVPLKNVTVTVAGAGNAGTVRLSPKTSDPAMAGCNESSATVTTSNGTAKVPVPYGVWTVCAKSGTKYRVGTVINTEDTTGTYPKTAMPLSFATPTSTTQC